MKWAPGEEELFERDVSERKRSLVAETDIFGMSQGAHLDRAAYSLALLYLLLCSHESQQFLFC